MIEKPLLQEMFDRMEREAGWDLAQPMLWGYFFTDRSPEKLTEAGEELAASGYSVVGLLEPADDAEDRETLILQVERIETHTVDTLHQRNLEFYALADQLGLASYDGMDVGQPPAPDA